VVVVKVGICSSAAVEVDALDACHPRHSLVFVMIRWLFSHGTSGPGAAGGGIVGARGGGLSTSTRSKSAGAEHRRSSRLGWRWLILSFRDGLLSLSSCAECGSKKLMSDQLTAK
jgi:hypothetical protein